ncbi:MAG: hypothetical protein IPM74_11590 [Crocinitomicaceae bacterium]|nr:hypothetical protein [Crocinitomicaceae bacterium]MBK8926522.1 hypothetical protein [Crocinitomicaceae bacterium]
MRALIAFCVVLASTHYLNAQNPTVISDSLVVQQRLYAKEKLVVDQEARFKQDVIVKGDLKAKSDVRIDSLLKVDGTTRLLGNVKMEGLGNATTITAETEIVLILPNGSLIKGSVTGIVNAFANPQGITTDYCTANGGIAKWWAVAQKLFTACPDVNVGIRTDDPQFALDVKGSTYAMRFLAGNPGATTDALLNGYSENTSQDLIRLGGKIGANDEEVRFKILNDGTVFAKELRIRAISDFPDYVFDEKYALMSLKDLANFIDLNHHLPNMPTAAEVKANGMAMGELTMKIVEKIEEITLYCITLNNENENLKEELNRQSHQINELREEINSIKAQLKK